jgi:thioredoxin-related protein
LTKDGKVLYRKHDRSGGVPELVLYDGEGKLIDRQAGYETAEGMIKFMRQAFSAKELEEIAKQKALHELRYINVEDNE